MLSQHLCAPPSHRPRTSHSSCQGSGKEVCPHPLSSWYVQMSARPCSALIHRDLLVPALPLVPRDGLTAGDALGSKISSKEQEDRKSCSQHESFSPSTSELHWVLRERSLDSGVQTPAQPLASL